MIFRRIHSKSVTQAAVLALLLARAALLVVLLPPAAWAGHWADVALRLPAEAELFPSLREYKPVSWTPEQVASMRRRALLQLLAESSLSSRSSGGSSSSYVGRDAAAGGRTSAGSTSQLPICELNLGYRVVDLSGSNFTAIITLTNNRELDLLHWQVVWRYQDFARTRLARTNGAIALSLGSPAGAPVRLVDTFTSDGVPGAGGTFSFLAETEFLGELPPDAEQSLGIEALNINGVQCSPTGGGGALLYGACAEPRLVPPAGPPAGEGPAAVLVDSLGNSSSSSSSGGSSGSGSSGCWAHFCCGVVLVDPSLPPPLPPPPPLAPSPEPSILSPPPGGDSTQQQEQPEAPSLDAPTPQLPPLPPSTVPAGDGSSGGGSGSGGGSSILVPAAAGGGGAAAVLLVMGTGLLVRKQRQRRRHQQERQQQQQQLAQQAALSKAELLAAEASLTGSGGSGSSSGAGSPVTPGSAQQSPSKQALPTLASILSPISLVGEASGGSASATVAWGVVPAACQVTIAPSSSPAGKAGAPAEGDGSSCRGSGSPGKRAGSSGQRSSSLGGASSGSSSREDEGADLLREVVLQEQLGSGAFGTVYRAQWQGRSVAVKLLQTACGSRSRELDSFRQEARVLAGLNHPRIVCLLAACTVPPNICIIEELAEGGSLHNRLHGRLGARRRQPLTYGELLGVAADVAEAMCYLHPHIVHRDLKAQNVLLDGEGRAKVCDFGIAKFKDKTFVSTANGQAGTPAYMAPEMFDGKPITEKVDVYSFSVLCWEMLTGEVPWRQLAGPMQVIYQVGVLKERLPLPEASPPFLCHLIQECWEEDPGKRPGFSAIRQRLQVEMARVAADLVQQAQRVDCRSTVSETDASSAAAGGSIDGSSVGGSGGWPASSKSKGCASSNSKLQTPQLPVVELCSPFAGHAAPFSSSSSEASSGSQP